MKSLVLSSELLNDQTRRNKLEALIQNKSNFYESPKISIFNTTDVELQNEISKLLESGLYAPIGGFTHKNMILAKFEEIWCSWKTHAELKKLDVFQINHVKSEFFLAFEQLKNCTTKNGTQKLKKMLDNNPHIIITESDKSKNLNVMLYTDYLEKLNDIFEPDNESISVL
jgi:hypothetical protein